MAERKVTEESEQEPNPLKPVKRIFIEQDDGKIRYLEGDVAKNYIAQIDSVLYFMQLIRRSMLPKNFLQVEWKWTNTAEIANIFADPPVDPPTDQFSAE